MNKTKVTLYIIILLLIAIALFAFVKFSDGLFGAAGISVSSRNDAALVSQLNESDCKIYWIGDAPSTVTSSGLLVSELTPGSLNEQNLPFPLYSTVETVLITETEETNEDGTTVIKSNEPHYDHIKTYHEGECPAGATIVITATNLTIADYEIIFRSLSESNAVMYVLGKDAVKNIRSYLLMPVGVGNDFFSMKFTSPTYTDSGIMDKVANEDMNSSEWFSAFLKELAGNI